MLRSLYVKNYALIEEISVELDRGLTVITGETGAGKSILIDALSLLLGERATSDVIRKGTEKAIVEGTFSITGIRIIKSILKENDLDFSNEIIIRREISTKGQNRCFINDTPASLTSLKQIGDVLVDLHGQHDHQSLLRAETHVDFLDEFGGHDEALRRYRGSFLQLSHLVASQRELKEKSDRLKEKKDVYVFQMNEIDLLNPRSGEETALETELKILENSEKLFELTSQLNHLMYDGDLSIHDTLVQARKQFEALSNIDDVFANAIGEIKSAEIIVEELTKFLQNYNARIEFNPEKLEHLRERLGQLALLKKKYGGSIETMLAHRRAIGEEFALAENFEAESAKIEAAIAEERATCSRIAMELTDKRRTSATTMEKSVVQSLAELGISHAKFETRIEQRKEEIVSDKSDRLFLKMGKDAVEAGAKGIDQVEFFLSTNAGEDLKPLVKVASGGEVSRVMLALKSALAEADKVPLLIFDEIDVGVSGRIGQAVGMSLKKLSKMHQVITITHLPQIAGLADAHFTVEKKEDGIRTSTHLRKLAIEERIHEVAKLMSGEKVTETGLKSAKELMGIR